MRCVVTRKVCLSLQERPCQQYTCSKYLTLERSVSSYRIKAEHSKPGRARTAQTKLRNLEDESEFLALIFSF